MAAPLEVLVPPGAMGLPTWSCKSLAAFLYVSMAEIDVRVVETPYAYSSAGGELPVFRQGRTVVRAADALEYLRTSVRDQDQAAGLSPSECSDAIAYVAMITSCLEPAVAYLWWSDDKNYKALTWRQFAPQAVFPLNYVLPFLERGRVRQVAAAHSVDSVATALRVVRQSYATLSRRLGSSTYLFGDRPSSADAVLAAHVAMHIHSTIMEPEGGLRAIIAEEFPNLERHCFHVLRTYVPGYKPPEGPAPPSATKKKRDADAAGKGGEASASAESDKSAQSAARIKMQSMIFVGLTAALMVAYRVSTATARR